MLHALDNHSHKEGDLYTYMIIPFCQPYHVNFFIRGLRRKSLEDRWGKPCILLREFNWDLEGLETAFSQRTRLADTEMLTIGSVCQGRLPRNDTAMVNGHKVAWDSSSSRMLVNAIEVVVEHVGMMVQIWKAAWSRVSCKMYFSAQVAPIKLWAFLILLTYHPQPHCAIPKAPWVYDKSSRLLLSHISDNRIWSSLQYFMHSQVASGWNIAHAITMATAPPWR